MTFCERVDGVHVLFFSGKTSMLAALARREVEIPDHIDTFLLRREMPPSDKTALECVIEVDEERIRLDKEVEDLSHRDDPGEWLSVCLYACNVCVLHLE